MHGGKAYKRRIEYHITPSLAIMMMLFDASAKDTLPESIWTQCESLRRTLHERSPDTNVIFENIQSWYTTQIKPNETENTGQKVQFMLQYIEQVIAFVSFWRLSLGGLGRLPCYFRDSSRMIS